MGVSNEIAHIYGHPDDVLRVHILRCCAERDEYNDDRAIRSPARGHHERDPVPSHETMVRRQGPQLGLAGYELRQLESGLMEAATLYPDIPATNVTRMTEPAHAVADAIEAKDSRRFAKAVGEFTNGCNACHQSIGRGFIVMRVPSESPFNNQAFPPQAKP
jgi:hypothetical protein